MATFHERKKERTEHYDKFIKGWRLTDCIACNGSGKYDHFIKGRIPDCESCSGTGRDRVKPDCKTDIEPLIGQTLMRSTGSAALYVYIHSRRNVIYRFDRFEDDAIQDQRTRAGLKFGYDMNNRVTDWCFEDSLGNTHYLHQFAPI